MLNSPTATLGWKSLLIGVVRSLSPEVCKQHLGQWFSMRVILPLGTFGNVWSHLLSQVGGGMLTEWREAREDRKHAQDKSQLAHVAGVPRSRDPGR